MTTNAAAYHHKVDSGYFGHGSCQLEHQNKFTQHLEEESTVGVTGSVIRHKHHIHDKETSPLPFVSPGALRWEKHSEIKHQRIRPGQEQHVQSVRVNRSRREKTVRQGSGFIVAPPSLARVSSDPVDRPARRRGSRGEPNLRVNTLVLRSQSSSYFQRPLNSPTSPTLPSFSTQLSSREYQGAPSPPLHSSMLQHPSSLSQLSLYYGSSATPTEIDDHSSVRDRKKLSVSSASSVPSSFTGQIPATLVDPVVIDWTSPSTRRREYREIDKCNRGFRRAWKTIAPKCCWCKSWRRGFYVESNSPVGVDFNDDKDDDAESVRRYRLELEDDDNDEKFDESSAGRNNGCNDNDGNVDYDDEKEDGRMTGKERSILGSVRARLCRTASKGSADNDKGLAAKEGRSNIAMSEKSKVKTKKDELKERKEKKEDKKEKKKKKKNTFGEGLICFQLHEIPQ